MARFEKTRIHVASAVLALLGIYAVAGLVHAAWTGRPESLVVWAVIAVGAFGAAIVFQRMVEKKRRRAS